MKARHIIFDCDGTLVDTSEFRYRLYPGIKELLTDLSQDSILYVWTARDRASTLRILKELAVLSVFEQICTVDDALPKPHIEGLKQLVGDVDRNQVCMIGDTSNDILGARNFGIKSIGVIWNPQARADYLKETGADFLAKEPAACAEWIRQHL